ncbi:MAG: TetR/AcrR family transcriptional regulator [Spirochaetes bacterium]|nr:TetR/AcrR family transcriptional regulator [Spirochaetota bacterium]
MDTIKKRQNAGVRKPDIVRNFYQVILEEGIEGASIGKVAKRMGIHPSLIIHYFQNKENLIVALVDYIIRRAGEIYRELIVQSGDPGTRLRSLVAIFFSEAWYGMSDLGGDFAILSLSGREPRVDARLREMYALLKQLIVGELEKIFKEGGITVRDPKRAAEIIISMYEGYRHFKHFYIEEGDAEKFREDMIASAMAALTNN